MTIKIYKMNPNAVTPSYGTEWSACFDLSACLRDEEFVTAFGPNNQKQSIAIENDSIVLKPRYRALVPTKLIFDLEQGQSMRIHPRSGTAVKKGITLINCEGIVDADYVEETYVSLFNQSDVDFVINHGDRIAQAEIIQINTEEFEIIEERPATKTNRIGGVGSTGVK